ncbi:MAG: TonB-dependent receptor [Acidobacteria bacterium]|nr:TonB-dependent receptor [Acidobacteriota bacterium]
MKNRLGRPLFAFLSIIAFAFIFNVSAQDLDDVTIAGRITDSNGLAIVGAAVKATETETGAERTVITNDEGRYRLIELKPGLYKVTVSQTGFGTKERTELKTVSGQNVQIDFQLLPATVQAGTDVTVSGDDAPPVDTTRTIVGGTISEREIEELPNNSRNPLDLVLTLGGVTEEQLSTRDLASDRGVRGVNTPGTTPEEAGTFGLAGGAAYSNNITVDGLDNNDDRSASFRFQPSIDSVAEVQVITNQFSAEYGRASGGRINIRTKAGGNRFRGRAYYFFRDDNLNANTWNNNRRASVTYPNGIPRPPLRNNNPGFTFGGPVLKDKLFFFTSYEFDHLQEDTLLDAWVPVTNGNAQFSLPTPTNPAGAVNITTTVNGQSVTVPVAPYIVPVDTPAKRHSFLGRSDWNLNSAHNFTFSYQLGRSDDLRAFSGTNRIADSLIGRIRNTDAFNATHNFIASSSIVNQFRFQYSQLRPRAAQNAGELSPAVLVTFVPPGESSTTQIFGSTTSSSDRAEDRWQFQETFNVIAGKHTLRFGGDVQRVDTTFIDRFDTTGTYRFTNFVFFNVNSVSSMQQNFNNESQVKNTYFGMFAQDDWRVLPNLTLGFGLRYEQETVIDDNNNLGPRFAVAWNPFPKGNKTVIRFGAGLFYNRVLLRTIDDFTAGSQEIRFDSGSLVLPQGVSLDIATVRAFLSTKFPNPLTLDTRIPLNSTASATVRELSRVAGAFRSISPDIKIPESYQFNVGFERELFKGIVFETNYTYNKTTHLWREFNPNAPVLPANTPDRNSDGQVTFTDYLLGISTGASRFYQGGQSDTSGIHTAPDDTAAACTGSTAICYVNVSTRNNSSNCSTTAVTNNPLCRAFSVINLLRPNFAAVGAIQQEQVASIGNSEYHGLTFEIRNRYRKLRYGFGGAMRLVYTLASLKDDGIVNTSEATLPGDFDREFSRSLLDRRHRIAFSGTFDTPWWLGKLRLSPLFRYGSPAPFNISIGGNDRNLDDISNDRPNFTGDLNDIRWRVFGSTFPDALANRLSLAPIGSPGNLPRNAGRGPTFYLFDMNFSREFRVTERFRIRPSAEFGNILNMTVFSFGSNFIDFDLLNSTNPMTVANVRAGFLAPTRTVRPRQTRLGIRVEF